MKKLLLAAILMFSPLASAWDKPVNGKSGASDIWVEYIGKLGEQQDTLYKVVDNTAGVVCYIVQVNANRNPTEAGTIACVPAPEAEKAVKIRDPPEG